MTRKHRAFRGIFQLVVAGATAAAGFKLSQEAWTRLIQYRHGGDGLLFEMPPLFLVFLALIVRGVLDDVDEALLSPASKTLVRTTLRLVFFLVAFAVLCFLLTVFATDTTQSKALTGVACGLGVVAAASLALSAVTVGIGFLRSPEIVEDKVGP